MNSALPPRILRGMRGDALRPTISGAQAAAWLNEQCASLDRAIETVPPAAMVLDVLDGLAGAVSEKILRQPYAERVGAATAKARMLGLW